MTNRGPDGEKLSPRAELAGDEIPDSPAGRFVAEKVLHRDKINRSVDSQSSGRLADQVHGSTLGPTSGLIQG